MIAHIKPCMTGSSARGRFVFSLASAWTLVASALAQVQFETEVISRSVPLGASGFGASVSLSDRWLAVTDLNATQGFTSVSLYERTGEGWQLSGQIRPDDPAHGAAAASGSVAVNADSVALGGSRYQQWTGRVYTACLGPAGWPTFYSESDVVESPFEVGALFGGQVRLTDRWMVVAARTRSLYGLSRVGSVAVYERIAGAWVQSALLEPSVLDAAGAYGFGLAIAVDGDRIAVSAGMGTTNSKVHLYEFNQGPGWQEVDRVFDPTPSVLFNFGWSLALSAETLIVGEPAEQLASAVHGRAHVYEQGPGGWAHVATLRASDGASGGGDRFGLSVAVDAGVALIGARRARGVSGTIGEGAGYVFRRDPQTGWAQTEDQKLISTPPHDGGTGRLVAYRNGVAILSSWAYPDAQGFSSAYIFTPGVGRDVCDGAPAGATASPHLDVLGGALARPEVVLWDAVPNSMFIIAASFAQPIGSGPLGPTRPLCLDRHTLRVGTGLVPSSGGPSYLDAILPPRAAGVLTGSLTLQAWLRGPQGALGATNAVRLEQ